MGVEEVGPDNKDTGSSLLSVAGERPGLVGPKCASSATASAPPAGGDDCHPHVTAHTQETRKHTGRGEGANWKSHGRQVARVSPEDEASGAGPLSERFIEHGLYTGSCSGCWGQHSEQAESLPSGGRPPVGGGARDTEESGSEQKILSRELEPADPCGGPRAAHCSFLPLP